MIRTFTGPSDLTPSEARWVARRILRLPDAETWRSGCAFGVDTIAAVQGYVLSVRLELYVPGAPHNSSIVKMLRWYASYVCELIPEEPRAKAYRRRNETMVGGGISLRPTRVLTAFLRHEQFYRSGEWMTVNIAKTHDDIKIEKVIIPSG